jgi:hypothetical protein
VHLVEMQSDAQVSLARAPLQLRGETYEQKVRVNALHGHYCYRTHAVEPDKGVRLKLGAIEQPPGPLPCATADWASNIERTARVDLSC